jgi:RimJ/RimL family protein N-acetyltransferase
VDSLLVAGIRARHPGRGAEGHGRRHRVLRSDCSRERIAHGRGYATEAGRAVVTWAREAGFPRLWAGVWSWNVASRRVLAKLGFREAGLVEPHSEYGQNLLTVREL